MFFQVHSLLLDDRHFTIVSQDALAGEFCVSDLADKLPFFQSFEEEGFFPGFVFELESSGFCRRFFLFWESVFTLEFIVAHFHASGWYAQDGVLAAAELFEEFCGVFIGWKAVIDTDGPDLALIGAEGFVYIPGLFGEGVQVLDEVWESFCSGFYAESLFELVQVGDVGDQAGWGVDWNVFFF
jgi:hypothetical protein